MKLIIDISENRFKDLQRIASIQIRRRSLTCEQIIANGTPLPKGHGRLIDADKLKAEFQEHHDFYVDAYGGFSNMPIKDKSRVDEITGSIASVVNAHTIIEADKEKKE